MLFRSRIAVPKGALFKPTVDLLGPATSIVSRLLEEDPTPVTGMTLETAKQGVHLLDATYLDVL